MKDLAAWLYGRVLARPHQPGDDPMIVIMIPLIGRDRAEDWGSVCALLGDTLASVEAQSYRNFQVILCSQDRPEQLPDAPNYHFVQAPPHDEAAGMSDHTLKIRLMSRYAADNFDQFSYVMHLDADDLMHPELLAYVANDNNGRGYMVERGYMLDASSGRLGVLAPDEGHTVFWRQCGSCAFFAVDWGRQPFPAGYLRLIGKGHKNYTKRTKAMGYPLSVVPFAAMLYLINHGDNLQNRKGHRDNKLRYLEGHEVSDPAARAAVYRDFGLPDKTGAA